MHIRNCICIRTYIPTYTATYLTAMYMHRYALTYTVYVRICTYSYVHTCVVCLLANVVNAGIYVHTVCIRMYV